jgi:hypothetical protein
LRASDLARLAYIGIEVAGLRKLDDLVRDRLDDVIIVSGRQGNAHLRERDA